MSFRSLRFLLPLVATAGFLAPWGCSATDDTSNTYATGSSSSTSTTTNGTGGGGGNTGGNGQGGFNFGGNSGQGGSTINEDAACAATSAEASLVPLDIVILLDRSGSMSGSKWNGSVAALTNFVSDPASTGINVGIVYFPHTIVGVGSCDYLAYDDLVVPIGELPMNAQAMIDSLNAQTANGSNTPMYGAIRGALAAATSYQDANPSHKVIMVFASDGYPGGCGGSLDTIPVIAALADSAFNYNGVQTYVIAINGSSVSALNQIAAAGGTNTAYDVTADIALFSEKMAEIRTSALACESLIPPPPPGEELDTKKVAVKFTDGMMVEVEIPRADDAADCGSGPGWYYDDNMNPTKIILCPASCNVVQADPAGRLNILFGCEPDVN
jgi:Mg-chelatase subunit ChlD